MNRLQEGLVLGDRYSLSTRIASGGMGDVWEADDDVLSRSVAVKVLRPGTDEEEVFARRFRSEALYTANLCHPNIATVFDYGEDDNLAYLVMELVPGEPLSALVQREGALEPERVRAIMGQAALALGAAHEAGVVHRDVKPANILVMPDGTVKLTDFGIARAVDGSGHTQTGEVLGTPALPVPRAGARRGGHRRVRPLRAGHGGARAAHRQKAFRQGHARWRRPWRRSTTRPRRCPRTCRRACASLIEQCLAKKAGDRPASARELGERLGRARGDLPAATEDAADVVGTAAAAEESVDDRPAAPPRWTGGMDPTPTPTSVAVVVRRGTCTGPGCPASAWPCSPSRRSGTRSPAEHPRPGGRPVESVTAGQRPAARRSLEGVGRG